MLSTYRSKCPSSSFFFGPTSYKSYTLIMYILLAFVAGIVGLDCWLYYMLYLIDIYQYIQYHSYCFMDMKIQNENLVWLIIITYLV